MRVVIGANHIQKTFPEREVAHQGVRLLTSYRDSAHRELWEEIFLRDEFAAEVCGHGEDPAIAAILDDVCRTTQMGFAAVARVTEERWIACQIDDRLEFGLNAGDELEIKKTICDDIRKDGQAIIIDHVGADPHWRTHPVPVIYGFKSYASLPIVIEDGSFYGTLCALDPEPRQLSAPDMIAALTGYAEQVAEILSAKISRN